MKQQLKNLKEQAQKFNIDLTPSQLTKFEIYWSVLNDYNSHTNLVASSELTEVFVKHFLDSLSIGLIQNEIKLNRIIDIGAGAGFPSIPIAIAFENVKVCAMDSVGKKTRFLELLVKELGIENRVEVKQARAEEIAFDKNYREKFDIAFARAVSHLSLISEYCLPFVKIGGYFVPYKAKTAQTELKEAENAILTLGGEYKSIVKYEFSTNETYERNLILIKKETQTPLPYPRNTGIIKRNPL